MATHPAIAAPARAAAHFALLAQAHLGHAAGYMSDAAKIHAESHGGNTHAHS